MSAPFDDEAETSVSFALRYGPQGLRDEAAIAADPGPARGFGLEDLYGEIRIARGPDQAVIGDDILNLAWDLCLETGPALLAGEACEMDFSSRPGGVRLTPEDGRMRLTVAGVPQGLYEGKALALRLRQCAQRLARALLRLGEGDTQVQGAAQALLDRAAALELG